MKVIKKYTAIKLKTQTVNDVVEVKLEYGDISGPYYSVQYPEEEHDTEQEAIEYAHQVDKWGRWLIVPIIKFDNFD